ncbi:hypothetical protein AB3329_00120 [Streptococcus sp. H31]|uniref:hypothetical protein n=1 Tax=Streptococcus huangxiaojuni TaxID=3237239 RepID=UPI0034A14B20
MESIYFSKEDLLEIFQDGENYILKYPTFNVSQPEAEREISKAAVDSYLSGEHTGKELLYYAETGMWEPPLTQEESNRQFLREHPEFLLIDTDSKKQYFSEEEFADLLEKGRQISQNHQ